MSDHQEPEVINAADLDFKLLGDDVPVYETESVCMRCGKQGLTRLMLTKIPNFREVIIASFECHSCGWRNSEANLAGEIQDFGRRFKLTVNSPTDLGRQVVKSGTATLRSPELEFEVPPEMLSGVVTTVEGILRDTVACLLALQDERREHGQGALADAIDAFCSKITAVCDWTPESEAESPYPFTIDLDDPAGNSFIENPHAPKADKHLAVEEYRRTEAQCEAIGTEFSQDPGNSRITSDDAAVDRLQQVAAQGSLAMEGGDYVQAFATECPVCAHMGSQRMTSVDIPHFKEVIIMAYVCEHCGYRTREVKAGGAFSEKAKRTILSVEDADDLNRDVLKGELAVLRIPEIDLELSGGVLAGTFTTVEGILNAARSAILRDNPLMGDSTDPRRQAAFDEWLAKFDALTRAELPFTFEIDDPVDNSYIQSYTAPDPDPQLASIEYERSWEQNEALGLNDVDFQEDLN